MKCFTTLVLLLISLALSAQAGTIRVVAPCFGPDTVNFSYDATVDGRNQYIDDDGDPTTNSSLRIAYNPLLMRWEIRVINDAQFVFYATGTNSFAPDPPSSLAATYHGTNLCPPPLDAPVSVTGTGTQDTAGPDPCSAAGGDDDNDGVCNEVDACPGFDDKLDRDGDGAPDGCDPTFDGVAVTSDCFGGVTLDFVQTGTDNTGRNIYTNTLQGIEIAFNDASNLWEIRVVSDPTTVFYTNDIATLPNPPNSDISPYTPVGLCSQPATVDGGGTQDYNCSITCPENITLSAELNLCAAVVTFPAPTYSDACEIVNLTQTEGLASGSSFPVGTTTNTFMADFGNGLVLFCSFTVTVLDTQPPAVDCASVNGNRDNDPGSCTYTAQGTEFDPTATDNCTITSLTNDYNNTSTLAGETFPVGTTRVNWTAIDSAGNPAGCSIDIVITDNESPVLVCQNATFGLGSTGSFALDQATIERDIFATATDNCGLQPSVVVIGPTQFTCDDVGEHQVQFIKGDANGNADTCLVTITITDPLGVCNQPPTAVCQPLIVSADGDCSDSSTLAADFDGGSSDPNGDVLTFAVAPAGPYGLGTTDVILTVSDGQLSSQCVTTITVVDDTAPALSCPPPLVVECAEDVPPADTTAPTATDNCSSAIVTFVGDSVVVSGSTTTIFRTYRATDDAGNQNTCQQLITVADTQSPSFTFCPADVTVACLEMLPPVDSPTAMDNCDNAVEIIYQGATRDDSCGDGSYTLTRSWTATDDSGNSSTCEQVITVSTALSDPCFTLALELTYDPANNTTHFDWTLCRKQVTCQDLISVNFSLPCNLPATGVSGASTNQPLATSGVIGQRTKCATYALEFKNLKRGGSNNPQPSCTSFSYTLAGDQREYSTTVIPKAGSEQNLGFTSVGAACSCLAMPSVTPQAISSGLPTQPTITPLSAVEQVRLQAYPNPTQTDVTIEFVLKESGSATLEVYNLAGMRVARLYDGVTTGGELQRQTFKRQDLPAGTYVYRLQTASGRYQGKVVLLQ